MCQSGVWAHYLRKIYVLMLALTSCKMRQWDWVASGFSILAGWKDGPVSSKKLLNLCDFEWASTARYIIYISSIANLKEINSDHVICFPLGRIGPEKLLKQKVRALAVLEGNKANIEKFVGEHKGDLGSDEMAVLRSLYLQYKGNEEIVNNHIAVIGTVVAEIELGILQSKEEEGDDWLF